MQRCFKTGSTFTSVLSCRFWRRFLLDCYANHLLLDDLLTRQQLRVCVQLKPPDKTF